MLKGAHLTERKCREIVYLFCEDLTATQISHITGVSRITINAYLKMIRRKIASSCEKEHPFFPHRDDNSNIPSSVFFAFSKWNNHIYTSALESMNRDQISDLNKMDPEQMKAKSSLMQAVVDISNWKIYRLDQSVNGNGRAVMDEISGFWGLTKNRLLKFRGLNRNTIYLHIKECEFRYNYRNEDMNSLILQLINLRPAD